MINFNEKLGIRYGALSMNKFPELFEHIQLNGENTTYEEFVRHMMETIRGGILEYVDGWTNNKDESNEIVSKANIGDIIMRLLDAGLREYYTPDEEEFMYDGNEFSCYLFYLGGCPTLLTTSSNHVMRCKTCSPCLRGAGNLDCDCISGEYTLCPPIDFLGDGYYVHGVVTINGNDYSEVRKSLS